MKLILCLFRKSSCQNLLMLLHLLTPPENSLSRQLAVNPAVNLIIAEDINIHILRPSLHAYPVRSTTLDDYKLRTAFSIDLHYSMPVFLFPPPSLFGSPDPGRRRGGAAAPLSLGSRWRTSAGPGERMNGTHGQHRKPIQQAMDSFAHRAVTLTSAWTSSQPVPSVLC